jgi:hypothetical protein
MNFPPSSAYGDIGKKMFLYISFFVFFQKE